MDTLKDTTPRFVYYVDSTFYVTGEGYRAAVVVEGESGYRPTGDDDYMNNPKARLPYFWGPTLADAERMAERANKNLGIDKKTADAIVMGSIVASCNRSHRRRKTSAKEKRK